MPNASWIPLNDYSTKYKVSISTLRRRIRGDEVQHRFADGKYWLVDQPITKYARSTLVDHRVQESKEKQGLLPSAEDDGTTSSGADQLLASAQHLMQELKSAYVSVLHEKEAQIMQLKEEITDLKTLVRILESENDRLKANVREAAPIDSWLDSNFKQG